MIREYGAQCQPQVTYSEAPAPRGPADSKIPSYSIPFLNNEQTKAPEGLLKVLKSCKIDRLYEFPFPLSYEACHLCQDFTACRVFVFLAPNI